MVGRRQAAQQPVRRLDRGGDQVAQVRQQGQQVGMSAP
jgi:hypothetical protein